MSDAIHESAATDALLVVSTWHVRPGRDAAFERLAGEVMDAAGQVEGHLAGTVVHEPGTPDYRIVHRFRGRAEFTRWLDSPTRRDLHAALADVADPIGEPERITGLETWFVEPGAETLKPPPRWKMWLASFLGAYPLVVLFQWQFAPHLEDLPLLLRSAILPLILLSLMTYVAMPVITRLLRRWLYPRRS